MKRENRKCNKYTYCESVGTQTYCQAEHFGSRFLTEVPTKSENQTKFLTSTSRQSRTHAPSYTHSLYLYIYISIHLYGSFLKKKKEKQLITKRSEAKHRAMSSEKVPQSAMASSTPHVEFAKGVNGLDKIVLRESRGSSAEVISITLLSLHRDLKISDHMEKSRFNCSASFHQIYSL